MQKSYQEQQVLHQPDSLPQQQTVHHMQKVTSQTMVHRSQETRIVEQEEKENQEQIFLKHLVPNQYSRGGEQETGDGEAATRRPLLSVSRSRTPHSRNKWLPDSRTYVRT